MQYIKCTCYFLLFILSVIYEMESVGEKMHFYLNLLYIYETEETAVMLDFKLLLIYIYSTRCFR